MAKLINAGKLREVLEGLARNGATDVRATIEVQVGGAPGARAMLCVAYTWESSRFETGWFDLEDDKLDEMIGRWTGALDDFDPHAHRPGPILPGAAG